jgi:hypothetical protein
MSEFSPRLLHWQSISVREMSDGTAALRHHRMDTPSRRMVTEELTGVEQPARHPFTAAEMLLMAALELYVRRGGDETELPF